MKRITTLLAAAVLACATSLAFAQDIKIALIFSKTGALEAYAKQTQTGLMMGLEYATGGTMSVLGRKIVVIEKDDQLKADVAKSALAAAYGDDKVDLAIGPTSSANALAMLPVAEEYKKILLVEPAVADAITGDKWNRYIFRTARNSTQDAVAGAVSIAAALDSRSARSSVRSPVGFSASIVLGSSEATVTSMPSRCAAARKSGIR